MPADPRRPRSLAATLRAVLLALLAAFAVGLALGTWLRCRMERPPTYIGSRNAPPRATPASASEAPVVGSGASSERL